jgi:hypothetical protein
VLRVIKVFHMTPKQRLCLPWMSSSKRPDASARQDQDLRQRAQGVVDWLNRLYTAPQRDELRQIARQWMHKRPAPTALLVQHFVSIEQLQWTGDEDAFEDSEVEDGRQVLEEAIRGNRGSRANLADQYVYLFGGDPADWALVPRLQVVALELAPILPQRCRSKRTAAPRTLLAALDIRPTYGVEGVQSGGPVFSGPGALQGARSGLLDVGVDA